MSAIDQLISHYEFGTRAETNRANLVAAARQEQAELRRVNGLLVKAMQTVALAGDDIRELAPDFIRTGDVGCLKNYGGNIASVARAALAEAEKLG